MFLILTVSRTFHEVIDVCFDHSSQWISFPKTPQELQEAKSEWQDKFTFSLCIGAVDCTHVPIQRPPHTYHPDEYQNRKGIFSFNVQVTVNASETITSVVAKRPGSVHDSRIFRSSPIPSLLSSSDALLLGDSGYGLTPYLMTPYKNPTTPQQISFNKVFTYERVIVERVFGQLKRRFPILYRSSCTYPAR